MIAGKIRGGADKGEKADETDKEHAAGKDVDGEKYGSDEAGPADKHEHVIAHREPEKRGCVPETREADGVVHGAQIFGGGKNSVGADEAADLEYERVKGGEIDQPDSAEEKPAREKAVARAVGGIEQPAEDGGGGEVHGGGTYPESNIQVEDGMCSSDRLRSFGPAENRRDLRMTVRDKHERRGDFGNRGELGRSIAAPLPALRVDSRGWGIYFCGGCAGNLVRDERYGISTN